MDKCEWPGGIIVKPDGVNELDPCLYEEIERYENVIVVVSRCVRCGHRYIEVLDQDNTILTVEGE